jgi:putative ABC transport system permease protein
MLGLQFSISIFMLAMVLIVYFQNKKVESASEIYPRSQIITLQRLNVESIREHFDTLKNELVNIDGVKSVAYSSLVPYQQSNSSGDAGRVKGDRNSSFQLGRLAVDEHFFETYDIPLVEGRNFSREVAGDTVREDVLSANVIVNELALKKLKFSSASDAIGGVYYDFPDEREPRAYTIIGVAPDQNFQGFHNEIKPTVYFMDIEAYSYASIRVRGAAMAATLSKIESVWKDINPDYPVKTEYLDETFGRFYTVFGAVSKTLGGFAFVALALSLIGLFGLAAFMAESKTKEIGIRKVMGANVSQIIRLLVWQFSRPVMWALLFALPLASAASYKYLDFFADRLMMPSGIIAVAGILSVAFAWAVVAVHAIKIARANPIGALRYE